MKNQKYLYSCFKIKPRVSEKGGRDDRLIQGCAEKYHAFVFEQDNRLQIMEIPHVFLILKLVYLDSQSTF